MAETRPTTRGARDERTEGKREGEGKVYSIEQSPRVLPRIPYTTHAVCLFPPLLAAFHFSGAFLCSCLLHFQLVKNHHRSLWPASSHTLTLSHSDSLTRSPGSSLTPSFLIFPSLGIKPVLILVPIPAATTTPPPTRPLGARLGSWHYFCNTPQT